LGTSPGERRHHDDHEIALLLQKLWQGRYAVELGHIDIEDDDIWIQASSCSTASRPVRRQAATIMSFSSPIQRVNRRRPTMAASTTTTRIGLLMPGSGRVVATAVFIAG